MYVNICHHVYIYIYIYTDGEELSPEQIGHINIYGQAYDNESIYTDVYIYMYILKYICM
jgi:hypothetical protein